MNWKVAGGIVGVITAMFLLGNNKALAYSGGKLIGFITVTKVDTVIMSTTMAPRWQAMKVAAAKAGIKIHASSAFRTMPEQVKLYAQYLARFRMAPRIAEPGKSNHQNGRAVDIVDANWQVLSETSPAFLWLRTNAWRFGFNNDEGQSIDEAWHWNLNNSIEIA